LFLVGAVVDVAARDRLIECLRDAVERQGLRAFARSIGVNPGTVSRWAQGDVFPDGNNRVKLAKALGMSLEEFDRTVVQGRKSAKVDPVEETVALIMSLDPEGVARLQRALADRVTMFSATGASHPPKNQAGLAAAGRN
jgi:transcriptional regulator with XRE-family HTH domain